MHNSSKGIVFWKRVEGPMVGSGRRPHTYLVCSAKADSQVIDVMVSTYKI